MEGAVAKLKKFAPKSADADALVGLTLIYSPRTSPADQAAAGQRSLDAYDPSDSRNDSMREFYRTQVAERQALVGRELGQVVVTGFLGQSGCWPPLMQVQFQDGLAATLGVRDLSHPA